MAQEPFRNLSSADMATYFERSFQNPDVRQYLNTADRVSEMDNRFVSVGRYISVYATATGDTSQEAVSRITSDLKNHADLTRDKQVYLKEVFGPMIIRHHCQKMGIGYPLSIEDTPKVLETIRLQSKNNRFETHSFNGALVDEVRTNGLDISKEKFQSEFRNLERAGLKQPYQKGNLLFCELSYGTFGYALRAPERLMMSLGVKYEAQGKTQSTHDFCTQSLKKYVQDNGITESDRATILDAGQKIIDFYFRPEGNKSAIAVRKMNPSVTTSDFESDMWKSFGYAYYRIRGDMVQFCRRQGDEQNLQLFEEAYQEFRQSKKTDSIKSFVQKFTRQYPHNNPLTKVQENFLYETMNRRCLNNYDYANCDGYVIPGGRLSPQEFSLAVLDNPIDVYVAYQKNPPQPRKQKYGILFGSDDKKYMVPLDENGRPIIPEALKRPEKSVSNRDLLRAGSDTGRGQAPLDKHNAIDYRDVGGKDRKPEVTAPIRPESALETERQRRRTEIERQFHVAAQLAAKTGHRL